MAYTSKVAWETLRTLAAGAGFTGAYQAVGGPLLFPAYKLKMVNNSTVLVTVSIDGINDVDVAPASSFWLYDETITLSPSIQGIPAGTQIFIKGTGGTGSVYLVSQYLKPI
jgi:hypothetical protein